MMILLDRYSAASQNSTSNRRPTREQLQHPMNSYQHSLPGQTLLSAKQYGTAVDGFHENETCHRNRSAQRRYRPKLMPRVLVGIMAVVLFLKGCGEWSSSVTTTTLSTSTGSGTSLQHLPLYGSAHSSRKHKHNRQGGQRHDNNDPKSHKHTHSNTTEAKRGNEKKGHSQDYYTSFNEENPGIPGKHHHKHVDVHVVVDDDDFTLHPNSSSDDSSRQDDSSNSDSSGSEGSSYDWQKCEHSKDPDCWKNLYAASTSTPTGSPSFPAASTAHKEKHSSKQKDKQDTTSVQDSNTNPTPTPSVIDWKAYGKSLNEKMKSCTKNKDPECWKHLFAPESSAPTPFPSFSLPLSPLTTFPTISPSNYPMDHPTLSPSAHATLSPTIESTNAPTLHPTSSRPSEHPIVSTTSPPTLDPTPNPTASPTVHPTNRPTIATTSAPTNISTGGPTLLPKSDPTITPTARKTANPTPSPTSSPSAQPTKYLFSPQSPNWPPTPAPSEAMSPVVD